jgi:hypothetical protein
MAKYLEVVMAALALALALALEEPVGVGMVIEEPVVTGIVMVMGKKRLSGGRGPKVARRAEL